jgi:hypothetical protein
MDKTNRLAEPRSTSEGGQGRDIYNNENGKVPRDTIHYKRERRKLETYNDSDMAANQTMRYYFDDDWFDNDRYYRDNKKVNTFVDTIRNKGDAITPQRCVECKRPFQRIIPTPSKGKFAYINSELFANIPLEDGLCGNCE